MSTSEQRPTSRIKPFWSPLLAGIALGVVLLLTFALTGHGLGASGAATDMVAGVGLQVAPETIRTNGYLGPLVADGSPIGSWMTWEIVGVALGALVGAFVGGRFRVQVDGEHSIGIRSRLIKTLAGGFLAGFGARIAGGCTSGVGLSGSAALGISAFVFLALFFATGMLVSRLVRGV